MRCVPKASRKHVDRPTTARGREICDVVIRGIDRTADWAGHALLVHDPQGTVHRRTCTSCTVVHAVCTTPRAGGPVVDHLDGDRDVLPCSHVCAHHPHPCP